MDIGLLLLRLTLGLTLAAHGTEKLFGWFGGYGLDGTGQFMEGLGFRPGRRHALMAGLVESGGGLLLALGFLTPLGGALTTSVMLVAVISVHLKNGFLATNGGYEFPLVFGLAALSLSFTGPGGLSVDAILHDSYSGVIWGVGSAIVALIGAAGQLAQRRVSPVAESGGSAVTGSAHTMPSG
jgi:putative oxidoreductase